MKPRREADLDVQSAICAAVEHLIATLSATLTGRDLLTCAWIDTPIGPMLAVADPHALHLLEFADRKVLATELARLVAATGCAIAFGQAPPIERIAAELAAYFIGQSAHFSTPLALHGSAFTRAVWDGLSAIPPGVTRSYSEIAVAVGRPSAVRAVARANGANQICIVIPCHRVIGADGTLTGYGGGLWRKQWLIEHERQYAPFALA